MLTMCALQIFVLLLLLLLLAYRYELRARHVLQFSQLSNLAFVAAQGGKVLL